MSVFTHEIEVTNTPLPIDGGNPNAVIVDGSAVTQPVSGTVNIGTMPEVEVKNDAGNPIPVTFSSAALTPTVTSVSVGASVVTLLAANSARQRAIVFNESGTLFVKLGTGASSTDYTYRLVSNTLLEINFAQTAAITAIKQTGTTNVQVTSLS